MSTHASVLWSKVPGRFLLGKLGVWLIRVGEAMEKRFLGWNSEFRMKIEYPSYNKVWVHIHVSERLVNDRIMLSFDYKEAQPALQSPLVRALLNIQGVTAVHLQGYEIQVCRAEVFSWRELEPKIVSAILDHLPNEEDLLKEVTDT